MDFSTEMKLKAEKIEKALNEKLPLKNDGYDNVVEAMRYSVLGGGKRIRGILTISFSEIFEQNLNASIDLACAVEMIHAYSLIHDDLPCMDNDDMRRGKPSCHVKFGEATALLAGDALLTKAFQVASEVDLSPEAACKSCLSLSKYAGVCGMIGGQVLDLSTENSKNVNLDTIIKINKMKTGALIKCAVELGCIAAGADDNFLSMALIYADNIGQAFQLTDDILDVEGDQQILGKPIGSDLENNKRNFVSLMGIDSSRKKINELTQESISFLSSLKMNTSFLEELTVALSKRIK